MGFAGYMGRGGVRLPVIPSAATFSLFEMFKSASAPPAVAPGAEFRIWRSAWTEGVEASLGIPRGAGTTPLGRPLHVGGLGWGGVASGLCSREAAAGFGDSRRLGGALEAAGDPRPRPVGLSARGIPSASWTSQDILGLVKMVPFAPFPCPHGRLTRLANSCWGGSGC